MKQSLNFRTLQGQEDYYKAYEETLNLWNVEFSEKYVQTSFGKSHCIMCGDKANPPLVMLHAANCGSTIWYPNVMALSEHYMIYAIDLITEASKSILEKQIHKVEECALWLKETIDGLELDSMNLLGLSIGGWNAANFAMAYPERVRKLILLSPVQTFTKMYFTFFFKIMKMGISPSRKKVEEYIGWGSENEGTLPDSVINQFTIATLNISPKGSFYPKMLETKKLKKLSMPVMVLMGQGEFAFNVKKAEKAAKENIKDLHMEILNNTSHLISVSLPDVANNKIEEFLGENA